MNRNSFVTAGLLLFIFGLFAMGFYFLDHPEIMNAGKVETTMSWETPTQKEVSSVVSKLPQSKIVAAQIDEKENLRILLENGKIVTLSPMQRLMLQNPLANSYMGQNLGWGK